MNDSVLAPVPDLAASRDADLIAATRRGDDASFAELRRRHERPARAAARSLVRSVPGVDGLVDAAFDRVLRSLRAGKGPEVAFRPYLLTVLRHVHSPVRAAAGSATEADGTPDRSFGEDVLTGTASGDQLLVAEAFASLPERWQVALWHGDVEGADPEATGLLLGLPGVSTTTLTNRAREGFRQAYLAVAVRQPAPPGCESARPLLAAYERDTLPIADRALVAEHLEHCEACRRLRGSVARVDRRLASVLVPLAVGVPAERYCGFLDPSPTMAVRWRRTDRRARVAAAALVAAALLLAVVVRAAPSADLPELALDGTTPSTEPLPTSVRRVPGTGEGDASAIPGSLVESAGPLAPADDVTTSVSIPALPRIAAPPVPPLNLPPAATLAPGTTQPRSPVVPVPLPTPGTTTPATAALDLGVAPGSFVAGGYGYVELTVRNGPPAGGAGARFVAAAVPAVTGAEVVVSLPAGLTFSTVSRADWTCASASGAITCTLPRVDGGGATSARLELVAAPGTAGPRSFSAIVRAPGRQTSTSRSIEVEVASGAGVRYERILRGGMLAIGNASMTCDDASPGCADARSGSGDALGAGAHVMVPIGADGVVANSSTAALDLPAGATVELALLTWSGDPSGGPGGSAAIGAPESIRFVGPSGTVPVAASVVHTDSGAERFVAVADVTALVTASGDYAVQDVASGTGTDRSAGWAMVVVYGDPAAAEAHVVLRDPVAGVGGDPVTFAFRGILPSASSRAATLRWVAFGGERGTPTESATVGGTALDDASGAAAEVFDSSVPGPRDPGWDNAFGVDVDRFTFDIAPGASATDVVLASPDDAVRVALLGLVIPV